MQSARKGRVLFGFFRAGELEAFSSALNYFYSLVSAKLPANMIQAQRDYFGAHTFERTDELRGQFFHENWTGYGGDTKSGTYNV